MKTICLVTIGALFLISGALLADLTKMVALPGVFIILGVAPIFFGLMSHDEE